MGGSGAFTWTGIVLGGSFLFLLMLSAATQDEAEALRADDMPTPLYERDDGCTMPCTSLAAQDVFVVDVGLREVHFVVYARLDASTGPARVTITDPSGDLRYDRLFGPDPRPATIALERQESAQWEAEIGEWTLTRSYLGVQGHLDYEVWGMGLATEAR